MLKLVNKSKIRYRFSSFFPTTQMHCPSWCFNMFTLLWINVLEMYHNTCTSWPPDSLIIHWLFKLIWFPEEKNCSWFDDRIYFFQSNQHFLLTFFFSPWFLPLLNKRLIIWISSVIKKEWHMFSKQVYLTEESYWSRNKLVW